MLAYVAYARFAMRSAHSFLVVATATTVALSPSLADAFRSPIVDVGRRARDVVVARSSFGDDDDDDVGAYVGVANIPGSDPDRPGKVNQDAFFCFRTDEETVVGVLDGHGREGHVLTEYLARRLPRRLRRAMEEETDDDDPFAAAFAAAQRDAVENPDVPASRSGTTCVVCAVRRRPDGTARIRASHVGDSRAVCAAVLDDDDEENDGDVVVLRPDDGGNGTLARLRVAALTREHVVARPEERRRVEESDEGRVDARGNVFYGPIGIAMTRALGDAVMKRAGVVHEPETTVLETRSPVAIVAATDGVWDVVPNADAVATVAARWLRDDDDDGGADPGERARRAADDLARYARERWQNDLPLEVAADDIACVVVLVP